MKAINTHIFTGWWTTTTDKTPHMQVLLTILGGSLAQAGAQEQQAVGGGAAAVAYWDGGRLGRGHARPRLVWLRSHAPYRLKEGWRGGGRQERG